MTEQRRPGRPRIHDTPADRVRAHRERKRAEAQAAALPPTPTAEDPEGAVTALADVLPLLRQEAEAMGEKMTAIAAQITAATTVLGDTPAVDAHLRRAQADAAKIRADADAELADMRAQLDTAIEERDNADAAADTSDADAVAALETLEVERGTHAEQLAAMGERHRLEREADRAEHEQIVRKLKSDAVDAGIRNKAALDELAAQVATAQAERDAMGEQLGVARLSAEREGAAAAATINRLDDDLAQEKQEVHAERERAETARQELNAALIELAEARAHAAAARERADELRAERDQLRDVK